MNNADPCSSSDIPQTRTIATWLQLVLIPACLAVAVFLPADTPPRTRIKIATIMWVLLTSGSTIVANVSSNIRQLFRFVLGPAEFRTEWVFAQIVAWGIAIIVIGVIAVILQAFMHQTINDTLGTSAICSIPAAIGCYLFAISTMPAAFFEEDAIGKAIFKFLGCKTIAMAPLASRFAAIALLGISAFLVYLDISTFAK